MTKSLNEAAINQLIDFQSQCKVTRGAIALLGNENIILNTSVAPRSVYGLTGLKSFPEPCTSRTTPFSFANHS